MTRLLRNLALSVFVALFGFAILGGSTAGAAATDPVKERHDAMESIFKALKSLSAIAKGETAFDAGAVHRDATTIADNLHAAADLFPAGSETGSIESRAKPEIWTNKADFDAKMKAAHGAALELAAVSEAAAFRPALGKLGNACKSCHDSYRAPEKEH